MNTIRTKIIFPIISVGLTLLVIIGWLIEGDSTSDVNLLLKTQGNSISTSLSYIIESVTHKESITRLMKIFRADQNIHNLYVVNSEDSKILYSTDEDDIGKSISTLDNPLITNEIKKITDEDSNKELYFSPAQSSKAYYFLSRHSFKIIGNQLTSLRYVIVSELNTEEVYNNAKYNARMLIVYLVIGVIFIFLLLFLLLRRNVFKPIEALVIGIKTNKIPSLIFKPEDELSVLASAFKKALEDVEKSNLNLSSQKQALDQFAIVAETDAKGKITYVNDKFCEISKYSREELIGQDHRLLNSKHHSKEFWKNFWTTIQSGKMWRAEVKNCAKDGSIYWVDTSVVPFIGVNGKPEKYLSIRAVITDRKLAEEKLLKAAKHFEIIFDTSPSGLLIVNSKREIIQINKQMISLFGYQKDELIGKKVEILVPTEFRPNHPEHVSSYFKNPKSRSMGSGKCLMGLKKDGSELPIEIGLNPIHLDGELFTLASVIDVSERRKIEGLKNEFVSTVSHELRTPLTSIRGSLGLVVGGAAGELPDKAKNLLQIATSNCERLVRLINDILDIEKIESGKMDFQFTNKNIAVLIHDTILASEGFAKQYDVIIKEGEGLSKAYDTFIDRDRITQVITNLISNAVKFSPKKSSVLVDIAQREKDVLITVKDSGPGIPDEFKSKIFSKFSQADSSDTRQKGGTGLGLNICKAIVEKHGGEIGYETTLGQGTTFFFSLPNSVKAATRETAPVESQKYRLDGKPKFLVCEDDPDITTLIKMMLEKEGYSVDLAYSAIDAKRRLSESQYVGMTLDINLPDQDGLSLLADLRAQDTTKDLPVIIISAKELSMKDKEEQIVKMHLSDWLTKPIDAEKLSDIVSCLKVTKDSSILHVEDDPDVIRIVQHILSGVAAIDTATSFQEAKSKILKNNYDIILLDLSLPDGSGLNLLSELRLSKETKVVIFSAVDASLAHDERIAAVLLKSTTSNDHLKDTIKTLLEKK